MNAISSYFKFAETALAAYASDLNPKIVTQNAVLVQPGAHTPIYIEHADLGAAGFLGHARKSLAGCVPCLR